MKMLRKKVSLWFQVFLSIYLPFGFPMCQSFCRSKYFENIKFYFFIPKTAFYGFLNLCTISFLPPWRGGNVGQVQQWLPFRGAAA